MFRQALVMLFLLKINNPVFGFTCVCCVYCKTKHDTSQKKQHLDCYYYFDNIQIQLEHNQVQIVTKKTLSRYRYGLPSPLARLGGAISASI